MKKWLSMLLILGLLTLSGCESRDKVILDSSDEIETDQPVENGAEDQNNSDEEPDLENRNPSVDTETPAEQAPTDPDAPKQKEPATTAISVEQERFGVKLKYQFDNEDSKILAKFIKNLSYDREICLCRGAYDLTLGEERYNVSVAEGDDDCYVRINGKQKNLTEEERDWLLAIFQRQLTKENRLPGNEDQVRSTVVSGEYRYSLTGSDSLALADILDTLEYKETTKAYSAPLRIIVGEFWLWGDLSAEEPYLYNIDGKMAKVGDRLADLKEILDRICRKENLMESTGGEVYVVAYGEPAVQYRFKNEDSAKILRWIENIRFPYGEEENPCTCKATYRIYNGDYLYLSLQQDGSAHFYDKLRKRHIVISKEDAGQLIEWFTPHCVKENEVPYYA